MTRSNPTPTLMLLLASIPAAMHASGSPAQRPGRSQIEATLNRFLRAFENLDMTAFIACFAGDATVFFPLPEPPERFEGKSAIQNHFEQVFTAIRKSSKSDRAPYQRLVPEDLRIDMLGSKAAVVSFHLRNDERVGRRTLVLQKINHTWVILHLHASNVSLPSSSRT
jgi:ketosteroid isomerase-like protein